jgi:hypothetical protein
VPRNHQAILASCKVPRFHLSVLWLKKKDNESVRMFD